MTTSPPGFNQNRRSAIPSIEKTLTPSEREALLQDTKAWDVFAETFTRDTPGAVSDPSTVPNPFDQSPARNTPFDLPVGSPLKFVRKFAGPSTLPPTNSYAYTGSPLRYVQGGARSAVDRSSSESESPNRPKSTKEIIASMALLSENAHIDRLFDISPKILLLLAVSEEAIAFSEIRQKELKEFDFIYENARNEKSEITHRFSRAVSKISGEEGAERLKMWSDLAKELRKISTCENTERKEIQAREDLIQQPRQNLYNQFRIDRKEFFRDYKKGLAEMIVRSRAEQGSILK